MPFLRVDVSSAEPVFAQIVLGVKRAVATGRLRVGDRLPSVRELARELVLNPNTVAKAYQVLEADRITTSRRGAGTFVARHRPVLKSAERRRRFRKALDEALADAVNLGIGVEEARKVFEGALRRFHFEEQT